MWVKLDLHNKWMQGKIQQVLPNQSYNMCLTDGHIFRHSEHHITLQRPSQSATNKVQTDQTKRGQHSYNLRQRKS